MQSYTESWQVHIMMTDYISLSVIWNIAQSVQGEHGVCNVLKYKNMIVTDFHKVSVTMANYNKWLSLMNHNPFPSIVVSHAPCIHFPLQAQVKWAINRIL